MGKKAMLTRTFFFDSLQQEVLVNLCPFQEDQYHGQPQHYSSSDPAVIYVDALVGTLETRSHGCDHGIRFPPFPYPAFSDFRTRV